MMLQRAVPILLAMALATADAFDGAPLPIRISKVQGDINEVDLKARPHVHSLSVSPPVYIQKF